MLNIPEYKDAARVFYYFEELTKIPHGSENTAPIAEYLVNFAKKHNLGYRRDSADNVIIKKPATSGLENRPTVIIQGHTDMVAVKLPELEMDMEREGLTIYRDGDLIRAKGTTLGGDDGVAVAYALALLESTDIPHPALECLFTSDEEIGLLGATALDASDIEGRIMINIDSDEEGIFTAGCAGGARTDTVTPVSRTEFAGRKLEIKVSGLLGGHSGIEIVKRRGNAIKIIAELLSAVKGIRLVSLEGGVADNAIPRDAKAYFVASGEFAADIDAMAEKIRAELGERDPDFTYEISEAEFDITPLDEESTNRVLSIITKTVSAPIAMTQYDPNLVETSENLGIVSLGEDAMHHTVSVRSAKGEEKRKLINTLKSLADEHGASFSTRGDYPAWEYREESMLRETSVRVWKNLFDEEAQVVVIHAGLECGILADKLEGLDCISLGPNNYDIHTTEERLSISSTAKVWEFLKALLKELK